MSASYLFKIVYFLYLTDKPTLVCLHVCVVNCASEENTCLTHLGILYCSLIKTLLDKLVSFY